MDTDRFRVNMKTDNIFTDAMLKKDLTHQTMKFNDRYHNIKPKKVIVLMKYELGGKIMIAFVGPKSKTYSYLMVVGVKN